MTAALAVLACAIVFVCVSAIVAAYEIRHTKPPRIEHPFGKTRL